MAKKKLTKKSDTTHDVRSCLFRLTKSGAPRDLSSEETFPNSRLLLRKIYQAISSCDIHSVLKFFTNKKQISFEDNKNLIPQEPFLEGEHIFVSVVTVGYSHNERISFDEFIALDCPKKIHIKATKIITSVEE